MQDASPHDFHDRGYKYLLSNLRLFQELMEGFVGEPWVSQLDFQGAERIDKTFVLESFLQKETDILYRVPMKNGVLYVYILVEHQSTVDFTMAFRLFLYIAEIWKDVFRGLPETERNRADFRLPPIFPIVLYNGKPEWTAARRLSELVSGSEIFGNQLPDFEYWFIDASHCDLKKLGELRNAVAAVFTMEQRPHNPEETVKLLEQAFSFILNDNDEVIWRTVWVWFRNWLKRNLGTEETERILAGIDANVQEGGEAVMSLGILESFAKSLEQKEKEGLEKGLEEGLEKGRLMGQILACQRFLRSEVSKETELQEMTLDALKRTAKKLEREIESRSL